MKALLVDDSLLSRKIQKRVLEEIGVTTILEAKDGVDALAKLESENYEFDVVLTDWNMPRMDGLQFIEEVRKREAGRDLPMIVVSSEGEREKIVHALKVGANSYVTKPFRKEVLARKVQSVKNVTSLHRQPASGGGAAISGDIGVFGFPELVHFLNFAGKSGNLRVVTDRGEARVGFQNGEIFDATFDRFNGEQAFFEVAKLSEGRFEFVDGGEVGERKIHGSTLSLLMEAMRMIDEEDAPAS